jgi:predicted Zn-dependent protease
MNPRGSVTPPTANLLSTLFLVAIVSFASGVGSARAADGGGSGEKWQRSPTDLRSGADLPNDFLLGLEASQAIAMHYGLAENDSLTRRVNDIGYRVAMNAGRPDLLFTFQVLDTDEPNSMALPGGWIFVNRGILDIGLTDDEVANLLGHEVSHVIHKDFSRQGRLDGLLSLLQTAVVVAVSMVGSAASQSQSPVIEDPGSYGWGYPQTSGEAAVAGTEVFGSVFHELLLRGYSRKIEMEADEGGRRLAGLAGYSREAGATLMQKLHDRIYEDREYGYWQTHPYFTDRVSVALAAPLGRDYPPSAEDVAAYRLKIQQGLASAASVLRDESVADYLYGLALRAGTSAGSNFVVQSQLLRFRLDRVERRDPLLRSYGPLEKDFDELVSAAHTANLDPARIEALQSTRDSVEVERLALLPKYRKALDGGNASTMVLEHYLQNFPNQSDANDLRLQLARAYRHSGRPDLAAEKLGRILSEPQKTAAADVPQGVDPEPARSELMQTLPLISDPEIGERLYRQLPEADLREAVADRMNALADTVTAMDKVGRFVQANPSSPFADRYRKRLIVLAEQEFKKGRLGEALGDQQSALTTYNRIVILAPDAPVANEARQGINRIQALAASGTDH